MGGASGVGGRGRATGGSQGRVLGGRGALAALGRPGGLGVMPGHEAIAIIWVQRSKRLFELLLFSSRG
jgi:hypothetical protein